MPWGKILIIFVIFAVLGWGFYNLSREKSLLKGEIDELGVKLNRLEEENKNLTSRIEFYQEPENLLKEVKSQFNYREAGEGLIIIVPRN